ncbi:site-specific DNA-methyltransferase [Brevibacterium sp. XM4083]|uniref:DNA-methyltransferase n=1 Tax=Brevibacterium sp. XM4083 TaxID=2583238 RepID=UPI00112D01FB|nr:site-specific DNA-methyltransferase [Brevibacterium sp. XM4083]MCM1011927.1 site-specific DNA-methyltransferase [Brevibacterium sp. XM4083]
MLNAYYDDQNITLYHGDALASLRQLGDGVADCIVTSPPYFGLRDYEADGQIGLEPTPVEYVDRLAAVFAEAHRVLADDGTMWLNLGDSYSTRPRGNDAGWDKSRLNNPGRVQKAQSAALRPRQFDRPPKSLLGVPWRVVFALQDQGWILRNEIIWAKPNSLPESVKDRLATRHERLFLLVKSERYWFDLDPIREPHAPATLRRTAPHRADPGRAAREGRGVPGGVDYQTFKLTQAMHTKGRNPGTVWTIPTQPFADAHFATFPIELPRRCILAGCRPGGTVLDPFSGTGTTGAAALANDRKYIGIDISETYLDLSIKARFPQPALPFGEVS